MSDQALLYHRPDGHILAHVPSGERNEEYEEHLREQHVPFRRTLVPAKSVPHAHLVDSGTGARVRVAAIHEHHYRTDVVHQDDGSVVERHFFHHATGQRRIFRKRTLVEASPDVDDTEQTPDDQDLTETIGTELPASAAPAARVAGGSNVHDVAPKLPAAAAAMTHEDRVAIAELVIAGLRGAQ